MDNNTRNGPWAYFHHLKVNGIYRLVMVVGHCAILGRLSIMARYYRGASHGFWGNHLQ
ncbi:TPA: hypothetical protein ACJFUB_004167 [Yersinia enterocolitica]|uniref:hypothetical protein n=1 Tax=Yersinia enterocolitica TaxID=630 RepID=UPI0028B80E8A|nr:hypothetical protein [Yersinia enterocolitica]ELI8129685.1 hypothetical protein [Yersinia enterocolitica]ELX2296609.1 hypothetical protein [Yersinia enterocolitica]HEI6896215.1 hypothetical protein [Yersinia enterocolitica]HEN3598262.1 hypothetical protein [Yersinia enterocolitica]